MERYKAYLLPGVAALILLAYFLWRALSGGDPAEPSSPDTSTATPPAAGHQPATQPAP